jgi:type I restriction enzyme M protein
MLPDQLFYNTGIYTYIWLLSNNKPDSHNKQIKIIDAREQYEKEPKSFGNKRNRMTEAHLQWIKDAYNHHWQTQEHPQIKLFKSTDFAYHKVSVVFWQTDEHDQPAFITEPYEKDFTAANIKRELDFYDSEITFTGVVLLDDKEQPFKLTLKPNDSFTTCYHKQLKALFTTELAEALKGIDDKDQAKTEKAFLKSIIAIEISFKHRHYVQDNEYIPYGEDIESFLNREIAKPIIRWQDSDQLGYEILPNKYFYHYQAPKPTAELLKDFWQLENDAVNLLKSLESEQR